MKNKFLLLALAAMPLISFAQKKISIIPSVGYAFRTASLASDLNEQERKYFKELKSGINFDIAAYYKLNNVIGLGLKYNLYLATNGDKLDQIIQEDIRVSLSTDDKIQFIGPAFLYSNFEENTRHKLYFDLGLGLISYKSVTSANFGTLLEVTGSNLGLSTTVGYMYELSPGMLIGPQVGYTGGTLVKMKANGIQYDLADNEKEGLHRITVSAGITFRL